MCGLCVDGDEGVAVVLDFTDGNARRCLLVLGMEAGGTSLWRWSTDLSCETSDFGAMITVA